MENASKALLIAGGILLAIIILSLLISASKNLSTIKESEDKQREIKQLEEFNKGYEAYAKKLMYGADLITVIHKAEDNNSKYQGNGEYTIKIILSSSIGTIDTIDKTGKYKCTKITYSDKTGRVNYMEFDKY